jgi:hypothetical protein
MFSEFRILIPTAMFPASRAVYGPHAQAPKKLVTLLILKCFFKNFLHLDAPPTGICLPRSLILSTHILSTV